MSLVTQLFLAFWIFSSEMDITNGFVRYQFNNYFPFNEINESIRKLSALYIIIINHGLLFHLA